MKITCQACQAKYTIADEKVVGKTVKIRCKKCGASIVVNGNEPASASSPPGAPTGAQASAEGATPWTVNVADGDQRTMTETEIVSSFRDGVVNGETFCWKEGMSDWLPLQEIASLHAACIATGPGPLRTNEDEELPTRIHDPSAGPLAANVAAAPRPPSRAPAHSPAKDGNGTPAGVPIAAARRSAGRASADLFSGAAQAGGEADVMTSAPVARPQPHADGPTGMGARGENVIFGLDEQAGAAAQPSTTANNEGSGLIDIRQLSAQMRSSAEEKKPSRVDDIMNLGVGGAFSPSLTAPTLTAPSLEHYSQPPPNILGSMTSAAPTPAKDRALVFLAIGAGTFFLIGAIGIAVLLLRGKESTVADREKTPASASAAEVAPPSSASPTSTGSPSASSTGEQAATAQVAASAGSPEGTSAAKEPSPKEAKEPAPALKEAKEPKEPKLAAVGAPKEAAPPVGVPAAQFDMGEARSRLGAIAGGVQTCKRGDTTGSGRVEIIFAPSGAVQSATLMSGSPFDGTPTGKCVEARFRGAHVPPFGGGPFTVTKSFSIN